MQAYLIWVTRLFVFTALNSSLQIYPSYSHSPTSRTISQAFMSSILNLMEILFAVMWSLIIHLYNFLCI